MKHFALLLVLIIAATGSGNPKSKLTIRVVDRLGADISDASVTIQRVVARGSGPTLQSVTDTNGEASVEVDSGSYDIFISTQAFLPGAERVKVLHQKDSVRKIVVKVDPSIVEQ